eukprot:TRINITY_DN335_c0_g1_i1.p1 TRINITY_DN335_c0_g1~~TRINITY_DN335_c0_g1_i1.p1  ORF type:complete len:1006 (-),score=191.51 TRINITY_DN335_c0_g1_i1:42-2870(-)
MIVGVSEQQIQLLIRRLEESERTVARLQKKLQKYKDRDRDRSLSMTGQNMLQQHAAHHFQQHQAHIDQTQRRTTTITTLGGETEWGVRVLNELDEWTGQLLDEIQKLRQSKRTDATAMQTLADMQKLLAAHGAFPRVPLREVKEVSVQTTVKVPEPHAPSSDGSRTLALEKQVEEAKAQLQKVEAERARLNSELIALHTDNEKLTRRAELAEKDALLALADRDRRSDVAERALSDATNALGERERFSEAIERAQQEVIRLRAECERLREAEDRVQKDADRMRLEREKLFERGQSSLAENQQLQLQYAALKDQHRTCDQTQEKLLRENAQLNERLSTVNENLQRAEKDAAQFRAEAESARREVETERAAAKIIKETLQQQLAQERKISATEHNAQPDVTALITDLMTSQNASLTQQQQENKDLVVKLYSEGMRQLTEDLQCQRSTAETLRQQCAKAESETLALRTENERQRNDLAGLTKEFERVQNSFSALQLRERDLIAQCETIPRLQEAERRMREELLKCREDWDGERRRWQSAHTEVLQHMQQLQHDRQREASADNASQAAEQAHVFALLKEEVTRLNIEIERERAASASARQEKEQLSREVNRLHEVQSERERSLHDEVTRLRLELQTEKNAAEMAKASFGQERMQLLSVQTASAAAQAERESLVKTLTEELHHRRQELENERLVAARYREEISRIESLSRSQLISVEEETKCLRAELTRQTELADEYRSLLESRKENRSGGVSSELVDMMRSELSQVRETVDREREVLLQRFLELKTAAPSVNPPAEEVEPQPFPRLPISQPTTAVLTQPPSLAPLHPPAVHFPSPALWHAEDALINPAPSPNFPRYPVSGIGLEFGHCTQHNAAGPWIAAVIENGPAAVAGLRAGDILVEIWHRPLRGCGGVVALVQTGAPSGKQVAMTVLRAPLYRDRFSTLVTAA